MCNPTDDETPEAEELPVKPRLYKAPEGWADTIDVEDESISIQPLVVGSRDE